MRIPFLIAVAGLALVARAGHTAPPPPVVAPTPSLSGDHFLVDLALLDVGGALLAQKQFDVALGQTQTVTHTHQGRNASVSATFSAGDRIGCVATKLVVIDRWIDSAGHFSRTDWSSTVQSCDRNPLTVGNPDQLRVRLGLKPTDVRPPAPAAVH